jgi:hypothetical protein
MKRLKPRVRKSQKYLQGAPVGGYQRVENDRVAVVDLPARVDQGVETELEGEKGLRVVVLDLHGLVAVLGTSVKTEEGDRP